MFTTIKKIFYRLLCIDINTHEELNSINVIVDVKEFGDLSTESSIELGIILTDDLVYDNKISDEDSDTLDINYI